MPTAPRRLPISPRRHAPLILAAVALAGCLQRVPLPAQPTNTPPVATVPAAFFAATPPASSPAMPEPFPGRYSVVAVEALRPDDPRAAYAAPLLGSDARFLQVTLLLTDLREPHHPPFAYELVTASGIFGALASGEWEVAVPTGATYRQDGVLLFAVPRAAREARLEIVEYAYPRSATGVTPTLRRSVIATFDLPRLP